MAMGDYLNKVYEKQEPSMVLWLVCGLYMVLGARLCRVQADLGSGTRSVNMINLTQKANTVLVRLLCSLTLSESAPPSLLPDFQPVLPVRPLSLQTGASAAAPFSQIASLRHFPLPALPSGRRAVHTHR